MAKNTMQNIWDNKRKEEERINKKHLKTSLPVGKAQNDKEKETTEDCNKNNSEKKH